MTIIIKCDLREQRCNEKFCADYGYNIGTKGDAHYFLYFKKVMHFESLFQDQTVNHKYYKDVLQRLRKKNSKKKDQSSSDTTHDNALAQSALSIPQFCSRNQMIVLH